MLMALPAAYADEASKKTKIEELLALMNARQMADQMVGIVTNSFRQGFSQQSASLGSGPEVEKLGNEIADLLGATVRKQMGWEDFFQPEMVRLYSDSFEESEIDGMVAFYRSPAGKAVIAKMPVLLQKGAELGQKRMQAVGPELGKMVSEKIEKFKREQRKP